MDWKLKKVVQEKIRDFQNKQKQKQRMTAKAYLGKNTPRPFTNGDFSQTFDRQWVVSPRGISCYLVPGFTPLMARFVHNNINSKEVCPVLVLRCQSASNLTCLVSFHRITCHMQFIWSFKSHSYIHAFIHLCTHTSILSCIHTFKHTQRTRTYTISIHTWLHQSPIVLFGRIPSVQSSIVSSG